MDLIQQASWFADLRPITARPATRDWVQTVHAADYVTRAEQACAAGQPYLDVPDVGISASSFDAALMASGAALALADQVVTREVDNAFALSRPPGHHAEASTALGFCLFNNVAIMARYLQQHHGLDKVLILDWDVHHGNGTQHSFESDPSVMYVSLHQYPYYPGTGAASETGVALLGATLNCPMFAGSGDAEYRPLSRTAFCLPSMLLDLRPSSCRRVSTPTTKIRWRRWTHNGLLRMDDSAHARGGGPICRGTPHLDA